jgi:hypothetical protein
MESMDLMDCMDFMDGAAAWFVVLRVTL